MKHQSCIDACLECAMACEHCLSQMIGKESGNDCPHCCNESASICMLCAESMARGSKFAAEICAVCAKACDWCAEQCGEHDHKHCQACAAACLKCAEECRAMAA